MKQSVRRLVRILVASGAVVAALLVVMAVNAWRHESRQLQVAVVAAPPIDVQAAAQPVAPGW